MIEDRETEYFTASTMQSYAASIRTIRQGLLCVDEDGAKDEAEQFYLLALDALGMAERYLALAALSLRRQG